jgi:hypothetical protein
MGVCVPDQQQRERERPPEQPAPWEPKGESPFGQNEEELRAVRIKKPANLE